MIHVPMEGKLPADERSRVDREKPLMLPAEPFLQWVRDLIDVNEGSLEEVSKIIGVSQRRVQAFRDGFYWGGKKPSKKTYFRQISIDVVDRCLVNEGRTFLWSLYPELYDFTEDYDDGFDLPLAA